MGVARWHRWVFEANAPLDAFARLLRSGLEARGARVQVGEHFDVIAEAFGSRAFVKLLWADDGIEATVKVKSGLFSSPAGLERLVLEAGREAQARLGAREAGPP